MLSITKLQNLKAIHNRPYILPFNRVVVINHKTTKFESNSQLGMDADELLRCCYQSQNYKIWKQFTTHKLFYWRIKLLLSITKLQNLKAIHNTDKLIGKVYHVVINHKTTKFESNSQLGIITSATSFCCYQSQNYKIWKQFTTYTKNINRASGLLSITKLQNLKAIHNSC